MRLVLLAQFRFLARAPWSAATAVLGVTVAVASVVAVHQIGTAVSRSLDAARAPHLAGLTHVLEHPDLTASRYFALRKAWRDAGWPTVNALIPIVEGYLQLDGQRTRILGADWLAYPGALARTDRWSTAMPAEVQVEPVGEPDAAADLPGFRLLEGATAVADRSLGLAAGGSIALAGTTLAVVGVVDGSLGPALYVDIATAQRLLARDAGTIDFVGLAALDSWARWRSGLEAFMPGFGAGLPATEAPPEILAAGFAARAIGSEQPATEFARAILFNVGALGLLALLVAWFLVHQVALIWVERQRPVFQRLHALGVAHATLATGFVAVFAVLGVVASVAGTGAGLWLADVLMRMSAPGGTAPIEAGAPDSILRAKAALSGVGICLGGGWLAFRGDIRRSRRGAWTRPALMTAAALVLAAGLLVESTGLVGGFGAILAMCLLTIGGMRPLLGWLRPGSDATVRHARPGSAARAPGRIELLVRLAVREAVWRPEVMTVALAALALAVATGMGVGLMVDSLRVDFSRMLQARLAGDLYVSGPAEAVAAAARWLRAPSRLVRVARHGEARVRVARVGANTQPPVEHPAGRDVSAAVFGSGTPALLGYGDFDAAESARYGHDAALGPREVLVNERLARQLALAVDDRVAVAGIRYRVVHVFPGFGDADPRLLMGVVGVAASGLTPTFDRLSVRWVGPEGSGTSIARPAGAPAGAAGSAPGPASGAIRELGEQLAERYPALAVTEREMLRNQAFAVFDRTFALTQALTLLALLVAGVGVYNALTALRLTQAPTRRLLEAQGVAPGELALVTLVRSCTVGTLAVATAAPLGIAMAWALCRIVNPRAFGWTVELHLAPGAWLPPLALGLAATLLAGMLPAPREQGALDETV